MNHQTDQLFHYVACGLSNVWLKGGVSERDTAKGAVFHVEQVKELHNVIGLSLVNKTSMLSPDEFRFLRTEMNFSRKNLGEALGVSWETIKKWESGDNALPKMADAWLRQLYLSHKENREMRDLIMHINALEKDELNLCLNKTSQGWSDSRCA